MAKLEALGAQKSVVGLVIPAGYSFNLDGTAGVTGGGFIVRAATLSSVGSVPVAGLALILGIDRFKSEARALTNIIGNSVATLVVARWTNAVDVVALNRQLAKERASDEH